jgi:ClpP class serine protease
MLLLLTCKSYLRIYFLETAYFAVLPILTSTRMWREIRLLANSKPVVASMSDVAASGGYYMAMAAPVIVAEKLTLTGSIGVVTGYPYYLAL